MSILIQKSTVALIQGITGKEGLKAAISMRDYGTTVVGGVTPGKGGSVVEGFPVWNTVREAVMARPDISVSVLYVPALAVLDAALEAMEAGISLLVIITEHVPVHDAAKIFAIATYRGVRVIGPSSIGIISPGQAKVGSIGGFDPRRAFSAGPIGILSKSGGMCSEIAHMLTHAGHGQSTVIGIGGDRIACSSFADILPLFEADPDTKMVVMYGEIGGTYEEAAAAALSSGAFTKPLVACISGIFAETLPSGLHLGHAGAIIDGQVGTRRSKVEALTNAGATVVTSTDELPTVCQSILSSL